MKQDRFLIWILTGIGGLIVIALVLFFTRKDNMTYVTDDSPEGVVHNYVVAIQKADYEKAYAFLAERENKPTYAQFRDAFRKGMVSSQNVGLEIGATRLDGDEATVELNMVYSPSDPFSTGYRNPDRALLEKQGGAWKLSLMPYNFWAYEWYQPTAVPPPIKAP